MDSRNGSFWRRHKKWIIVLVPCLGLLTVSGIVIAVVWNSISHVNGPDPSVSWNDIKNEEKHQGITSVTGTTNFQPAIIPVHETTVSHVLSYANSSFQHPTPTPAKRDNQPLVLTIWWRPDSTSTGQSTNGSLALAQPTPTMSKRANFDPGLHGISSLAKTTTSPTKTDVSAEMTTALIGELLITPSVIGSSSSASHTAQNGLLLAASIILAVLMM
jgi:hypothetical protein